ncbi:MAG: hypothetical protein KJ623_01085, partial [Nanoarchaeota archaeon]|nr:hypothetical protein [Nanoarchaeota archaeon]
MKFRWGLVGVFIFVFLLVAAPIFSAVSITINPANPIDSDSLTCLMNGAAKNFNAHWKGSGVTQQNIIINPLPASKTKVGTATCEAYVPNPITGIPLFMGSASVSVQKVNTCLLNQTPQLNISAQNINQNSQLMLNLMDYATDAENDPLTFAVLNENAAQADCNISSSVLTINTGTYNGTASCLIGVADSCSSSNSTLNINVNYVDLTFPLVNLIDNVIMDEDTNATLALDDYVSDAYDPDSALTWTASGNSNIQILIDPVTHNATFIPSANWFGSENITFTATDAAGNYGQDNIMVIVNPVNDMPWINPVIPNQTVQEDSLPWALDLKNYQHDVEAGPLTWTVSNVNNSLLNINIDSNNVAVFTLVPNKYGLNIITFTLRDSYGAN